MADFLTIVFTSIPELLLNAYAKDDCNINIVHIDKLHL